MAVPLLKFFSPLREPIDIKISSGHFCGTVKLKLTVLSNPLIGRNTMQIPALKKNSEKFSLHDFWVFGRHGRKCGVAIGIA